MPAPTPDQIAAALVNPDTKWSTPTITFSIPVAGSTWPGYQEPGGPVDTSTLPLICYPYPGSEAFAPEYQVLNTVQAAAFRDAIQAWADLIATPIVETNDLTNTGEIRVAFTNVGSFGGYTYLPPAGGGSASEIAGDIWISNTYEDLTFRVGWNFTAGESVQPVLLHEIGHALGLKHPFEGADVLPSEYLNTRYTVMSYNFAGIYPGSDPMPLETLTFSAGVYNGAPQLQIGGSRVAVDQPMVMDILAIQSLYGANPNTHAGDDVYKFDDTTQYITSIYDAGGNDTIDTSATTRSSYIDLTPGAYSSIGIFTLAQQEAYWDPRLPQFASQINSELEKEFAAGIMYGWQDNVGIAYSTTIENAIGGAGNDTIIGNSADNKLTGGPGNDVIDGRGGSNTAVYAGPAANYYWTLNSDGSWSITGFRSNANDGTDHLTHIHALQFADQTIVIDPQLSTATSAAIASVLRITVGDPTFIAKGFAIAADMASGALSQAGADAQIIQQAQATTSVATLAYQFFTGAAPGAGGMDYLVSPTGPNPNNLNSAYYQSFSTLNRYINFAVNLGSGLGAGSAAFAQAHASETLAQTLTSAYTTIFGTAPSADKVSHLLNDLVPDGQGGTYARQNYFAAYGGDGLTGVGTKAAMVGWLLAEAVISDLGSYAKSNDAFLTDVATHNAAFGIDIIGHYNQPGFAYTGG
jgi:serralysin